MVTTVSKKKAFASVRFRRSRLPFFLDRFSGPCSVFSVSIHGMVFECGRKLERGTKITVQLLVPGGVPLDLRGTVAWCGHVNDAKTSAAAINFLPFGKRKGENPDEALEVLGKLQQQYRQDEKADRFNPVRDHLF